MRIFVPATPNDLRLLADDQPWPPELREGVMADQALAAWAEAVDEEELALAALSRAADLAIDLASTGVRVVVVMQAEPSTLHALAEPPGATEVSGLRARDVVAFYVDSDDAAESVLGVRAALNDNDEDLVVTLLDELDGFDLQWFAPEELGDLCRRFSV